MPLAVAAFERVMLPGATATIVVPAGIPAALIACPALKTLLVVTTLLTVVESATRSPVPAAPPLTTPQPKDLTNSPQAVNSLIRWLPISAT